MTAVDEALINSIDNWTPALVRKYEESAFEYMVALVHALKADAPRPITDRQVEAAAEAVCKELEGGLPCTNFHVHESHKRIARAALEASAEVVS